MPLATSGATPGSTTCTEKTKIDTSRSYYLDAPASCPCIYRYLFVGMQHTKDNNRPRPKDTSLPPTPKIFLYFALRESNFRRAALHKATPRPEHSGPNSGCRRVAFMRAPPIGHLCFGIFIALKNRIQKSQDYDAAAASSRRAHGAKF